MWAVDDQLVNSQGNVVGTIDRNEQKIKLFVIEPATQ
jgi:hypothetical protein